jgi:hypothetical protein
MKKVSSPVEIYRIFKDGTIIRIPANGEVVCDDEKALEIKSIYPFVRVEDVENTEKIEEEVVTEQAGGNEEQGEEPEVKQEKKSKKGRKSKEQK